MSTANGETGRLRNEGRWAEAELLDAVSDDLLDAADQAPDCDASVSGLCLLTDEGTPCAGSVCGLSGRNERTAGAEGA